MQKLTYNYKTKNTPGYNTIELGIYYEIGGYNYFNYTVKPRCFYIGALAMNMTQCDGYSTKQYAMFDNSELANTCQNVILKEVTRFNNSTLEKMFKAVDWEKYGQAIENKDLEYIKTTIDNLKTI